ncbi:MAG TPA: hypothetical protein PKA90_12635 [Ignavibacteria bacterium]|nr:hypothetical protein [Ignavibacteria bacterium]HMR41266.1 hypothetical protein [Ignavibacteria bacterium]
MAQHNVITNDQIQKCIDSIQATHFTTFRVVKELETLFPETVKILKSNSERNWRSVIGKAIKRFSVETGKIKQISPAEESPARWEKK